ncbi:ABC transporter ATP-binding protein [Bittarella massiliensis (ex Durand et al. 2017)]|uniref:ABC transporter ATP-binding protein n=1 Tax=Bittarella massiliensis (ex Durand et al. 2017) TaxID=1720313 RepID=UPI000AE5499F|nr:ABC transporter ATP-binding protein [Bittarella massiliensis (ex Durand et al. 2017)]
MCQYDIEMTHITKQYPLVLAVDDVSFRVRRGEVHALVGENGAGKTTLMKILYGMTSKNGGEIAIGGKPVNFKKPGDAIAAGIGMVHQHFQLTPVLTVAENVVVGEERQSWWNFNRKKAIAAVNEIIREYGFKIDAGKRVGDLSVGEQQRVEIIKALYRGAQILILDEPTAVLTPQEVDELFKVIDRMRSLGKTVIIITHKLKEAIAISDAASVMRDGKMVKADVPIVECSTDLLAKWMVGRDIELDSTRRAQQFGETVLEVKDLCCSDRHGPVLKNIDLRIRAGEILGIAGVEGNGQTELIEALTGLRTPESGQVLLRGEPLTGGPLHFLQKGVGHVPEDRLARGLIKDLNIRENLILGYQWSDRFAGRFFLKMNDITEFSRKVIKDYRIKAPSEKALISALSGGNQQKVIIGRVFEENPQVIIVAQPTRGVDIGAMEYIHEVLLNLRDAGAAILLISADLDEVRRLSDTLAVLYEGEIVTETPADTLSEQEIGMYMLSGKMDGEEVLADGKTA